MKKMQRPQQHTHHRRAYAPGVVAPLATQHVSHKIPHWTRAHALSAFSLSGAVAIFCGALASGAVHANTNTVKLAVAGRVASFFRVQTIHQAKSLTVTQADITRGYIDLPAASRFSVATNVSDALVVDFQPQGSVFVSMQVNGLQSPVEFGAQGGSATLNAPRARMSSHQLDYRFYVRHNAQPGTYAWPVKIFVHTA